jgi:hypothetical protein
MPSWVPTQPTGPISCVRSLREQWQLLRFTWRLTRFASASFTRWRRGSRSRLATQERAEFFENMNDYTQKRASTARGMYNVGWTPYEISHALVISEATVLR